MSKDVNWNLALTALPLLESSEFRAGVWHSEDGRLPYFVLDPAAARVLNILQESGMVQPFDWPSWQPEADRLVRDPRALGEASLSTLGRLLTVHIRKDRFCEGHLSEMFESGHVRAILRRAAELVARPPDRATSPGLRAVELSAEQIEDALPRVAVGLKKYVWLQVELPRRDVSADPQYQKAFRGFYRVRRNADWSRTFFALLEQGKSITPDLETVLRALQAGTGRVEASFASKLVATLDPSQPVLDSVVLSNLGLRLPPAKLPDRISEIVAIHEQVAHRFSAFLNTSAGHLLIKRFAEVYPEARITTIKMLDLVLWQTRDAIP